MNGFTGQVCALEGESQNGTQPSSCVAGTQNQILSPTVTSAYITGTTTLNVSFSEPLYQNGSVWAGWSVSGRSVTTPFTFTDGDTAATTTVSPGLGSGSSTMMTYSPDNLLADAAGNKLASYGNGAVHSI